MDKQEKQEIERRLDRRSLLVGGAGLVGALSLGTLLAGCGGGSNQIQNPGPGNGRALLTIAWPDRTRLIPAAANSIKLTVTAPPRNPGEPPIVSERLVVRPAGDGAVTSTEVFDSLPSGNVAVTAVAYPTADGTGVVQAAASFVVAIRRNEDTSTALSLGTTIDRVQIQITPATPAAPALSLPAGSTMELVASALNAGGAVVVTNASSWTWTSDNEAAVTISASGDRATLTGVSTGTAIVHVVENESGKSAEITTSVPAPPVPMGLAESSWPKFHGTAGNTGMGKGSGATGVLKWRYGVDALFAPSIGPDGTLYLVSRDKNLLALDSSGTLRWKQRIDDSAEGFSSTVPAIAADGTVYITTSNVGERFIEPDTGYLHAVTAEGNLKWKCQIGNRAGSHPTIAPDGTIYLSSYDFNINDSTALYAINSNGTVKWKLPGAFGSGLAIAPDSTLYTAGLDGVHCVTPEGTVRWTFPVRGRSVSLGPDGSVYFTTFEKTLYALTSGGVLKWQNQVSNSGIELVPITSIGADGTIYICTVGFTIILNNRFVTSRGSLYALNADGSYKWARQLGTDTSSVPVIAGDGTIYAGTVAVGSVTNYPDVGGLYAFASDGTVKWQFKEIGRLGALSLGGDGTVYAVPFDPLDQYLYAIG